MTPDEDSTHGGEKAPTETWEALSRGVRLPARRRRLSPGAVVAVGLAAMFLAAMVAGVYSLGGRHGGGPLATVERVFRNATPSADPTRPPAQPSTDQPEAVQLSPSLGSGPTPSARPSVQPTCDPRSASPVACGSGYASPASTPKPGPTPPASPQPTPNPSGVPACAGGDVTVQARTDRASYTQGQTVTLTGAVTNHGSAPCTVYTDYSTYSCNPVASVLNSSGQVVWQSGPPRGSGMPCRMGNALVLQPGQTETHDWTWNQMGGCPGSSGPCSSNGQEPPGSYTGRVNWSGGTGDSAPFRIT